MGDLVAERRIKRLAQLMTTCKHFRGVQHGTCKAGVSMKHREGQRIPCLSSFSDNAAPPMWPCEKKELRTREEADAEEARREEALTAFLAKLAIGVCGVCSVEATDWEQAGSCFYAKPCGHRVGQGNAKEYKAGVLEARAKRAADTQATGTGKGEL